MSFDLTWLTIGIFLKYFINFIFDKKNKFVLKMHNANNGIHLLHSTYQYCVEFSKTICSTQTEQNVWLLT